MPSDGADGAAGYPQNPRTGGDVPGGIDSRRVAGGNAMGAMTTRRWIEYLVAILAGNALYFLVLYPALPPLLRHQPFRFDVGLALDFLLCVIVYGVMSLGIAHARRWNERSGRRRAG